MKNRLDYRIILNPRYKKWIFEQIFKKCPSNDLTDLLNISRGMLYHYKNDHVESLPLPLFNKLKDMLNLSEEEIRNNTSKIVKAEEIRNKGLILGRDIRRKKIKEKFRINFSILNILKKEDDNLVLNTAEWFKKTNWLDKIKSQTGFIRNVDDIKINNNHIELRYEVYKRNQGMVPTINYLPRKLILNDRFYYFLGLKLGDGTSGVRVGVVNKDLCIIKHTFDYLQTLFPDSEIRLDLHCYKTSISTLVQDLIKSAKDISNDLNICFYPKIRGDYVFLVYISNNLFSRIFEGFIDDIENLFANASFEQKGAFLAGFFDAEGNVNKIDGNLRFSQKISRNVKFVSELLIKEGYHIRYDGSNIVIAHKKEYHKHDLALFERQVLPYIVSPNKHRGAKDVINGYLVRSDYKEIVRIISKNPGINQREISAISNRQKSHVKLRALCKAGYVRKIGKIGETFKYEVSVQGLKWLEAN